MIQAAHVVLSTREPERLREFFRDVLGFPSVDAGGGWLIFALPPAEVAMHPHEGAGRHQLYLMCDDLGKTMKELTAKGVEFTKPVEELRWVGWRRSGCPMGRSCICTSRSMLRLWRGWGRRRSRVAPARPIRGFLTTHAETCASLPIVSMPAAGALRRDWATSTTIRVMSSCWVVEAGCHRRISVII